MKLLRLCLATGTFIAGALTVSAQQAAATFEVNHVRAGFLSNGQLFTDGQSGKFIPLESGLAEKTLLRSAGIWVVGQAASGQMVGAVQNNTQTDYIPGVLNLNGQNPSVPGIWELTCDDIREHVEDFADNGVLDHPNPAVLGWPSKGNPTFEINNPGQSLPLSEQALAGFSDLGPTFGTYEPEEGDAPSIELRGCPLLPSTADKMAWFGFNDTGANHASSLNTIGMELQTEVFAYSASDQMADKTIFVRYKMINRSQEILENTYVGVLADFAVGNPEDDFAGCDPDKRTLFAYNGDAMDEAGFGAEIPAVGMTLLRGPFAEDINGDYGAVPLSHYMVLQDVDNLQPEAYHRILSGQFADGSAAPDNGIMFQGNPNDANSNSELAAGNTPGKRVGVASFGPFTLYPGAVNEVVVAYSYAYASGNTPAQNAQLLLTNADGPRSMFEDCFVHTNNACSFSSPAREPIAESLRVYPNPGSTYLNIETDATQWTDIQLTNVLGQLVKQIQLGAPTNRSTVQLDDLPNGVYQLRIGSQVKSVVVQH